MLAFQTLDDTSKNDVRLPATINVDQIILEGTELLEEVGGQLHPMASRYLQSLRRMESKLKTLSETRAKILESRPAPVDVPAMELNGRTEGSANSFFGNLEEDFGESFRPMDDPSMVFNEDFSEIEDMFYSTGWFGQMGEWNEPMQ